MTTTFGPWPDGMDMRSADADLGSSARLLIDYVPQSSGRLSPRRTARLVAPVDAGSGLIEHAGKLYFIAGNQLCVCTPPGPITPTGVYGSGAVWAKQAGELFGFVGGRRVRIDAAGNIGPWGFTGTVRDADGVLLGAPPIGTLLVPFGGVLLIGQDNIVRWTEPYMPDVCDLHAAAVTMPFEVVLIAPTQEGVWFAGRTNCLFAAGNNPLTWNLSRLYNVGALGSAFIPAPDGNTVFWLSDAGIVEASGGVAMQPRRREVSLDGAVAAAVEYEPGVFVFALDEAKTPLAHPDYLDALAAAQLNPEVIT